MIKEGSVIKRSWVTEIISEYKYIFKCHTSRFNEEIVQLGRYFLIVFKKLIFLILFHKLTCGI